MESPPRLPPMPVSDEDGTVVKVEIVFASGRRLRLEGEEATKWGRATRGSDIHAAIHGIRFPKLDWEEDRVDLRRPGEGP